MNKVVLSLIIFSAFGDNAGVIKGDVLNSKPLPNVNLNSGSINASSIISQQGSQLLQKESSLSSQMLKVQSEDDLKNFASNVGAQKDNALEYLSSRNDNQLRDSIEAYVPALEDVETERSLEEKAAYISNVSDVVLREGSGSARNRELMSKLYDMRIEVARRMTKTADEQEDFAMLDLTLYSTESAIKSKIKSLQEDMNNMLDGITKWNKQKYDSLKLDKTRLETKLYKLELDTKYRNSSSSVYSSGSSKKYVDLDLSQYNSKDAIKRKIEELDIQMNTLLRSSTGFDAIKYYGLSADKSRLQSKLIKVDVYSPLDLTSYDTVDSIEAQIKILDDRMNDLLKATDWDSVQYYGLSDDKRKLESKLRNMERDIENSKPAYIKDGQKHFYKRAIAIMEENPDSPISVNVHRLLEKIILKNNASVNQGQYIKLRDITAELDYGGSEYSSNVKILKSKGAVSLWVKKQQGKVLSSLSMSDINNMRGSDAQISFRITKDFKYIGFSIAVESENEDESEENQIVYAAMIKPTKKTMRVVKKMLNEKEVLTDATVSLEIDYGKTFSTVGKAASPRLS